MATCFLCHAIRFWQRLPWRGSGVACMLRGEHRTGSRLDGGFQMQTSVLMKLNHICHMVPVLPANRESVAIGLMQLS